MHAKVVSLCGEQPRRENAQRDGRLGAMAERQKRSAVMSDDTCFSTPSPDRPHSGLLIPASSLSRQWMIFHDLSLHMCMTVCVCIALCITLRRGVMAQHVVQIRKS